MKISSRSLCLLPLIFCCTLVSAQKAKSPVRGAETRKSNAGRLSLRQQQALWNLEAIEGKAAQLAPSITKVNILAQLADTFWDYQEFRARRLFTAAFHAIDDIKLDETQDQRVRFANKYGRPGPLAHLRDEVSQLIARRDYKLAEKLQKDFSAARDKGESGGISPRESAANVSLELAASLAKTQPERCAQLLRESLRRGVNSKWLGALMGVRQINAPLAHRLFNEAIVLARSETASSRTFELLAVYVFPTEEEEFLGHTPLADPAKLAVIRSFLGYAAGVITARSAASDASDYTTTEAEQERYALQTLLPFFESQMPDFAPTVRARMATLVAVLAARQNTSDSAPKSLDDLVREAEATVGDRKRDIKLIRAAGRASQQGDIERALDIAERISSPKERMFTTATLLFGMALRKLDKGEIEETYRFAKRIDFLPQRVAAFNKLAQKLWADKKDDQARAVLEEIWDWTSKSENSTQKANGLLILTATMASHDVARGFEYLQTTVAFLNATDFSYDAERDGLDVVHLTIDMLDFDSSFGVLAKADFERAAQMAQTLTHKEAALLAQIVVCQQVLAKNAPTSQS